MADDIKPGTGGFQLSSDRNQRLDEIKVIIQAVFQGLALMVAVLGLISVIVLLIALSFAYPDRINAIGASIAGLASFVIMNWKTISDGIEKVKTKLKRDSDSSVMLETESKKDSPK